MSATSMPELVPTRPLVNPQEAVPDYCEILDNSKRSVSIRINTSDYGRIKAISKRLKVRESDVFRFLLKIGLRESEPLAQSKPSFEALMRMLANHASEFVGHFNLSTRRLEQLLAPHGVVAPHLDSQDLELLAASILPERYLAMRLQEITGQPVLPEQAQRALGAYLCDKYLARSELA